MIPSFYFIFLNFSYYYWWNTKQRTCVDLGLYVPRFHPHTQWCCLKFDSDPICYFLKNRFLRCGRKRKKTSNGDKLIFGKEKKHFYFKIWNFERFKQMAKFSMSPYRHIPESLSTMIITTISFFLFPAYLLLKWINYGIMLVKVKLSHNSRSLDFALFSLIGIQSLGYGL